MKDGLKLKGGQRIEGYSDLLEYPDWTNEVGQAIGVNGGSLDITKSVSVVGVGEMQPGFLNIIDLVTSQTKEIMGATDAALGEVNPENTSAILALQEASGVPLETIRQNLYQCVEDLANIWAEFMMEYYADGRMVAYRNNGVTESETMDFSAMKTNLVLAKVEVGATTRFSNVAMVQLMNNLLYGGFIPKEIYLKYLPDNILPFKQHMLEDLQMLEQQAIQMQMQGQSAPPQEEDAAMQENIPQEDSLNGLSGTHAYENRVREPVLPEEALNLI